MQVSRNAATGNIRHDLRNTNVLAIRFIVVMV